MTSQRTSLKIGEFDPTRAQPRTPRPAPKVCAVHELDAQEFDTMEDGEYLEGAALRERLIAWGRIVPLSSRKKTLATDDIGRAEAANGIFYNEPRVLVREFANGGRTDGPLPDPAVVAHVARLRDDPAALEGREGLFAPGGGRIRYARWRHPAPEEPCPMCGGAAHDLANPIGLPSPERDALELVMSVREVLAVPGMSERDEARARGVEP